MKLISKKGVLEKYSRDKSFYKITPKFVLFPKNEQDIINAINYARKNKISITARGGGTGLSGAGIGEGIILDMSKHFTKVYKIDRITKLQTGILLKKLNPMLKKEGYILPSVPLQEFCAIGGNLNTRSIGPRTLKYGTMDKQVISLRGVMSDGRILDTSKDIPKDLAKKIINLRDKIKKDKSIVNYIKNRPFVAGGYNLKAFLDYKNINDITTHLIVGSVGTLIVITEAKLKLPKLKPMNIYLVHFNDLDNLQKSLDKLIKNKATSIEYAEDDTVMFWEKEFRCENAKYTIIAGFEDKVNISKIVENSVLIYNVPENKKESLWKSRAKALPMSEKKARIIGMDVPSGIDDTTIYPKDFAKIRREISDYSEKSGVQITVFGHLGVGSLHLRPLIDMRKNPNKLDKVAMDIFKILRKYGGTLIGEHNSGLCRSRYLKMESEKMYNYMKELKDIFDQENILNPKVIFNLEPMMKNLAEYK